MAMSMGMSGSMGAVSASSMGIYAGRSRVSRGRRSGGDVQCAASTGRLTEQYRTLRVQPGASEKEIKKAFRQLALQVLPFSLRFYFSALFLSDDLMRSPQGFRWSLWKRWEFFFFVTIGFV